ncbi:hypothetical protein D3C79_894250 [compost metagenome]
MGIGDDQQARPHYDAAGGQLQSPTVASDQATRQRSQHCRDHQAQRQCAIDPMTIPAGLAQDGLAHDRQQKERATPDHDLEHSQAKDADGSGETENSVHKRPSCMEEIDAGEYRRQNVSRGR